MKLALWLLACCVVTFTTGQQFDLTFKWRRRVESYSGEPLQVTESTQVDTRNRTMLMSALDAALLATAIYRSDSMHDFVAGLVAIRPVGADLCLVGPVRQSYDDTLAELRRRELQGEPASERRQMEAAKGGRLRSSGSAVLDDFCRGRSFIRVIDSRPWPIGPRWPPLLCIWGPIDVDYPFKELAPIENWRGGFGYFP